MARKRELSVFSLSFLDIMSCGFGAVILIYIVIHHSTEVSSQEKNLELLNLVEIREQELDEDQRRVIELKNTMIETDEEIADTRRRVSELIRMIRELQREIDELEQTSNSKDTSIEQLMAELKKLEAETDTLVDSLASNEASGRSVNVFSGEGDRQYLTGIKIGGKHILLLLDGSASMLANSIVNVIQRRNLPDTDKRNSVKWQRAIRTMDWITANMPHDGHFQLYTFNTEATSAFPDRAEEWIPSDGGSNVQLAVDHLREVVPAGGTSLHGAFDAITRLSPLPDNIYLVTDSLPTQGVRAPRRTTVTGKKREEFFEESLDLLPGGIPVNIILFPMEGDPLASPNFWYLAQISGGSFLSPSDDWP